MTKESTKRSCSHRIPLLQRTLLVLSAITLVIIYLPPYTQVALFRRYSVFDRTKPNRTRHVALEKLHRDIWRQIRALQEEGECNEKKVLLCENYMNFAGFGSMVMRYGACMQIAFGLGRAFFITQPQYEHFGGIFRFLEDESRRCGHIKTIYNTSEACDMQDRACYLENGYEINNTYKVLKYRAYLKFPAPRRVPGTIPSEIERQLEELGVETPWLWFTSQFLGYLLLRLKPDMKQLVGRFGAVAKFGYPLVSMHVRHGDKLNVESKYVHEEEYLKVADEWYRTFLPNVTSRRIYVASDDRYVYGKLTHLRPINYDFLRLPLDYTSKIVPTVYLINKNFPKEVIESIIIDIHFLLRGNLTVCTYSSNICRLVWSLKASTPPYTIDNRIYSVDENPHLGYYDFYGYMAPLHNLWVTIRSLPQGVLLPDGSHVMRYSAGTLFYIAGDDKLVTVNGEEVSIAHARVYQRYGRASREGFVYKGDVVEWPGLPSYHFYH